MIIGIEPQVSEAKGFVASSLTGSDYLSGYIDLELQQVGFSQT